MSEQQQAGPEPGVKSFEMLAKHMGNAPVAPAHGIAAIALDMAMKFHSINTVQDGALYQQYKLEGRNMTDLHIDMVFETAMKIEAHLLGASERIAKIVVDAISFVDEEDGSELSDDATPLNQN